MLSNQVPQQRTSEVGHRSTHPVMYCVGSSRSHAHQLLGRCSQEVLDSDQCRRGHRGWTTEAPLRMGRLRKLDSSSLVSLE